MDRRITLDDIARRSGVSLATVSLVLRGKPGINDETRQRVLDTARTLGYRRRGPEPARHELLQQVGVLVRSRAGELPQSNQFYAPVLAGIEAACRKRQINMLYATLPVDEANHPVELPRMLQEDQVDGLLLVGAFVDTTIDQLMRHDVATVLVDAYAANNNYDSVVSDNFRGAYQAVSYLLACGHRQIAVVGSQPAIYPSIDERRRGYLQALRDHGVAEPHFADSDHARDQARAATRALLQRSPGITAVFCCNDDAAFGAMQAAADLGRVLPDELSVVGFDDIDSAAHVTPALTTMRVDKINMGRIAVQLLAQRLEFADSAAMTVMLQPELIERQSVRRCEQLRMKGSAKKKAEEGG